MFHRRPAATSSAALPRGRGAAFALAPIALVVLAACTGGPAPTPTPAPTVEVNFTANATAGPAPLSVRFTDASGGSPYHWWWQFGDGGTSTQANPTHTYAVGSYTASLVVTDSGGKSSTAATVLLKSSNCFLV